MFVPGEPVLRTSKVFCNRNELKLSISTAWQITEVSNSEKQHAVNTGNHRNTVERLHSSYTCNFEFLLKGQMFPFLRNNVREAKKGTESFREQKLRVHNSQEPLESRTLICWHKKFHFFLRVASFWLKKNPVYQKAQWNADRSFRYVRIHVDIFYTTSYK